MSRGPRPEMCRGPLRQEGPVGPLILSTVTTPSPTALAILASSCDCTRRSWVAQAVDSAAMLRTPSRRATGWACSAICSPTTVSHRAKTVLRQMPHMPAVSAGQVEHFTALLNQVGPALHPGAGRISAMGMVWGRWERWARVGGVHGWWHQKQDQACVASIHKKSGCWYSMNTGTNAAATTKPCQSLWRMEVMPRSPEDGRAQSGFR